MRLTLRFWDGVIEGEGEDLVGEFTMAGEYDVATNKVDITKSFRTHIVLYEGTWDGTMIAGFWEFSRRMRFVENRGDFEIWPERDEQSVEVQLQVESKSSLEPVRT